MFLSCYANSICIRMGGEGILKLRKLYHLLYSGGEERDSECLFAREV